ncbi:MULTISPECIES: hypothetical protein [Sediminimonas]|uniref:Ferrochelatase n=1 Tax=Sediminimonas qiaohouensis TaxID=552061 RepID=A0A7C9HAN3_9RHOB|nr:MULTISPECIES: hypothetical protein [Sediminimonas]MDR9485516.1 hypothetical protein [Sediminimonas sp.]MTJ04431.1 hypothetical protein [Sediminimonas qiaohouensis]
MKKLALAAALSAACLAPAANAGGYSEPAVMAPVMVEEEAATSSASDAVLVFGTLLIGIVAVLAQ